MTQSIQQTLNQLRQGGIVAQLPGDLSLPYSLSVADAMLAAPVLAVEVQMMGAESGTLITDLCRRADGNMLVGVNGVETGEALQTAVSAGAQFLSSPTFDLQMAQYCQNHQVVYIPGVISIMAAQLAANAGSRLIRLRTGGDGGPAFVQHLQDAFPELGVLVAVIDDTDLTYAQAYARMGAVALLAGSSLFAGTHQSMAEMIANARQYRQAWEAGRAEREQSAFASRNGKA